MESDAVRADAYFWGGERLMLKQEAVSTVAVR
jgi:hypothetical protein